jgi:hypothetical protein
MSSNYLNSGDAKGAKNGKSISGILVKTERAIFKSIQIYNEDSYYRKQNFLMFTFLGFEYLCLFQFFFKRSTVDYWPESDFKTPIDSFLKLLDPYFYLSKFSNYLGYSLLMGIAFMIPILIFSFSLLVASTRELKANSLDRVKKMMRALIPPLFIALNIVFLSILLSPVKLLD